MSPTGLKCTTYFSLSNDGCSISDDDEDNNISTNNTQRYLITIIRNNLKENN